MKIREQIKDRKNIHAERVTVEKNKKKKERKKNQKMWSENKKEWKKKERKENEGQYEHFLFLFQWLLSLGLTHVFFVVLFGWNCIAENFVAQFDVRGSSTIV